MPLCFARSILTRSAPFANTQSAQWDILSGGFSSNSSQEAFGLRLMTDFDGLVNNTDSTITVYPTNSSFRYNSNYAWTIEGWFTFTNATSLSQSNDIFTLALLGDGLDATGTSYARIEANGSNVYFYTQNSDSTQARTVFATSQKHFALSSNGSGTCSWFLNGSRIIEDTSYTDTTSLQDVALGFYGTRADGQPRVVFEELRISDVERYSSPTYTVPTSAFTTDANTLGLFHCDANRDDSSRG